MGRPVLRARGPEAGHRGDGDRAGDAWAQGRAGRAEGLRPARLGLGCPAGGSHRLRHRTRLGGDPRLGQELQVSLGRRGKTASEKEATEQVPAGLGSSLATAGGRRL